MVAWSCDTDVEVARFEFHSMEDKPVLGRGKGKMHKVVYLE